MQAVLPYNTYRPHHRHKSKHTYQDNNHHLEELLPNTMEVLPARAKGAQIPKVRHMVALPPQAREAQIPKELHMVALLLQAREAQIPKEYRTVALQVKAREVLFHRELLMELGIIPIIHLPSLTNTQVHHQPISLQLPNSLELLSIELLVFHPGLPTPHKRQHEHILVGLHMGNKQAHHRRVFALDMLLHHSSMHHLHHLHRLLRRESWENYQERFLAE
jgi:hypothetical protein